MKRPEIEAWLIAHGWTMDRWGHYRTRKMNHKQELKEVRMKMQTTSIRYEVTMSGGEWGKLASDYYKNCYLMDGRLHVGNLLIG